MNVFSRGLMSLLSPLPHPFIVLPVHPPPLLGLQEFSFSQVWASNQRPLQCAFSLERYSHSSSQLSCKISVRQVKGEEQILQVYTSVVEVSSTQRRRQCVLVNSFFMALNNA